MNTILPYTHPSGLPGTELKHASGSSVRILDYGAHICSWQSHSGEVLMMSRTAEFKRGTAIRGGIPICFPQFSRRGSLPAHGFARVSDFTMFETSAESVDGIAVGYRLTESPASQALWPYRFSLEIFIELNDSLSIDMRVRNTDSKPFDFTTAFHTYFKVADISNASIHGLAGKSYKDFLAGDSDGITEEKEFKISGATDRVYPGAASASMELRDIGGNRRIRMSATGFPDAVVWNPWKENNLKMKDLHPDAYLEMACVEAGHILVPVVVEPGEEITCGVRYSAVPLGGHA